MVTIEEVFCLALFAGNLNRSVIGNKIQSSFSLLIHAFSCDQEVSMSITHSLTHSQSCLREAAMQSGWYAFFAGGRVTG